MTKHVSTFGKPLSELSDKELAEEAERRRKRRARAKLAAKTTKSRPAQSRGWQMSEDEAQLILQFYANLELEPGATKDEVEKSYQRLMKKYHPGKHEGDPDKHRAAVALTESLTKAYRELTKHIDRLSR